MNSAAIMGTYRLSVRLDGLEAQAVCLRAIEARIDYRLSYLGFERSKTFHLCFVGTAYRNAAQE
jgi:hypothetical protein